MNPRRIAAASLAAAALVALVAAVALRRQVNEAYAPAPANVAAFSLAAVPPRPAAAIVATSGDVQAVAVTDDGLILAGGFGVAAGAERTDLSAALPLRRMSALHSWRGRLVAASADGGLFVRRGGEWAEMRSGFGLLHVRTLAETAGGELLIGAREGLLRVAFGGAQMERLAAHPVRAIALAEDSAILSGGERGAFRTAGTLTESLATQDPWVEDLFVASGQLFAVSARGLESATGAGFALAHGGSFITTAVAAEGEVFGLAGEWSQSLHRFAGGAWREEVLPAPGRRVFAAGGMVYVDTAAGLMARTSSGFRPVSPRPPSTATGAFHVGALARFSGELAVGLFDEGLYLGTERTQGITLRRVPAAGIWAVNALLPSGDALFVASLRGASRVAGGRVQDIEGPGAAFSLATTPQGVAIGYGQGVKLGDSGMLSAFHGLPGNQALALLFTDALYVGTPSGLGAIGGTRVLSQGAAQSALPNPWVSALAQSEDGLHVATYGGGVARRPSGASRFVAYPETAGFKVNPGCLVDAGGRLFLGTDDRGLFVREPGSDHFEPVEVLLPSARISALLADSGWLYVGTDAGIARLRIAAQ